MTKKKMTNKEKLYNFCWINEEAMEEVRDQYLADSLLAENLIDDLIISIKSGVDNCISDYMGPVERDVLKQMSDYGFSSQEELNKFLEDKITEYSTSYYDGEKEILRIGLNAIYERRCPYILIEQLKPYMMNDRKLNGLVGMIPECIK